MIEAGWVFMAGLVTGAIVGIVVMCFVFMGASSDD